MYFLVYMFVCLVLCVFVCENSPDRARFHYQDDCLWQHLGKQLQRRLVPSLGLQWLLSMDLGWEYWHFHPGHHRATQEIKIYHLNHPYDFEDAVVSRCPWRGSITAAAAEGRDFTQWMQTELNLRILQGFTKSSLIEIAWRENYA